MIAGKLAGVRCPMSRGGGRRAENWGMIGMGGGQRSEVGGQRADVEMRGWEKLIENLCAFVALCENQGLEGGGWRLEVGGQPCRWPRSAQFGQPRNWVCGKENERALVLNGGSRTSDL